MVHFHLFKAGKNLETSTIGTAVTGTKKVAFLSIAYSMINRYATSAHQFCNIKDHTTSFPLTL